MSKLITLLNIGVQANNIIPVEPLLQTSYLVGHSYFFLSDPIGQSPSSITCSSSLSSPPHAWYPTVTSSILQLCPVQRKKKETMMSGSLLSLSKIGSGVQIWVLLLELKPKNWTPRSREITQIKSRDLFLRATAGVALCPSNLGGHSNPSTLIFGG